MSSATNGSQGLKKKISIRMLTIALFVIGGVMAAVVIYQQFVIASNPTPTPKPYAISKLEAITIALNEVNMEPNRDAQILPHTNAEATLIHIGNDGWSFLVDENSLGDTWAFRKVARFEKHEGEYVWYVEVTTSNINGGSRGYWYLIDVDSGRSVGSGSNAI
ncbi:MAG TPA: hypothetical protein VLA68_06300 [Nitrososphaera sp.]|nr:hypothetical protein [Nitrososphaera sp.]